jgi:hypothetical protein
MFFVAGMAVRVESCLPGHQHDVVKFLIISRISILFRIVWKTGKKARGFNMFQCTQWKNEQLDL